MRTHRDRQLCLGLTLVSLCTISLGASAQPLSRDERRSLAAAVTAAARADYAKHTDAVATRGVSCFVGEAAPYMRLSNAAKEQYLSQVLAPGVRLTPAQVRQELERGKVSCIGQTMKWLQRGLAESLGERGSALFADLKHIVQNVQTIRKPDGTLKYPGVSNVSAPAMQIACKAVLGTPYAAAVAITDAQTPPGYNADNHRYMTALARSGRPIYHVPTDRSLLATDFWPTAAGRLSADGQSKLRGLAAKLGEGAVCITSMDGGYHCFTSRVERNTQGELDLYATEAHLRRNPGAGGGLAMGLQNDGHENIENHTLTDLLRNTPNHGHFVMLPIHAPALDRD